MASSRLVANSTSLTYFSLLSVVFLIFSTNTVTAKECPERAIRGFEGYHTAPCYLFERFPTQFVTAERMCRYSGGHLASIKDGFVNAFVAQGGNEAFLIMEQFDDFWVGGHDLHNQSIWEWTDDLHWNYTNWDESEPSNVTTNRCLGMQLKDGKWRAEDCFIRKPYVCAFDLVDHNTTATPIAHNGTTPLPLSTTTHADFTTTIAHLTTSTAPITLLTSSSTPEIQWTTSSITQRATKTSTTTARHSTTRIVPTTTTTRRSTGIPTESSQSTSTAAGRTQTAHISTTPFETTPAEETTPFVLSTSALPISEITTKQPQSSSASISSTTAAETTTTQTESSEGSSSSVPTIQTESPVVSSTSAVQTTTVEIEEPTTGVTFIEGPTRTHAPPQEPTTEGPESTTNPSSLAPSSEQPASSAVPSTPEVTTIQTEGPIRSSSAAPASTTQSTTPEVEEPTTGFVSESTVVSSSLAPSTEKLVSSSPIPTEPASSSSVRPTTQQQTSTPAEEITSTLPSASSSRQTTAGVTSIQTEKPIGSSVAPASTVQVTTPEVEEPSTGVTFIEGPTRTHAPPQEPTTEGPESTTNPSSLAPSSEQPASSAVPSTPEVTTIQTEGPIRSSSAAPASTTQSTTPEVEEPTTGFVSESTTHFFEPSTSLPVITTSQQAETTPAETTTIPEGQTTTREQTTQEQTTLTSSTSIPPTTTEWVDTTCPQDWVYFDATDLCYWVMASEGWGKDKEACESMESSLAIVHDDMENSAIKLVAFQAPATKGKNDVSIGLQEVVVGGKRKWQWIDGSEVDVQKWYKGYPKSVKKDDPLRCGTYVMKDKNHLNVGLWKTTSCTGVQASAVCTQPPNFDVSEDARSMMEMMRVRRLQSTMQDEVKETPLRAHRHLARRPAV